jgi:hypothetical protein
MRLRPAGSHMGATTGATEAQAGLPRAIGEAALQPEPLLSLDQAPDSPLFAPLPRERRPLRSAPNWSSGAGHRVDLIVTPDQVIECETQRRPTGLYWNNLTPPRSPRSRARRAGGRQARLTPANRTVVQSPEPGSRGMAKGAGCSGPLLPAGSRPEPGPRRFSW